MSFVKGSGIIADSVQTSSASNAASTTETTLHTFSLPGSTLANDGQMVRITVGGVTGVSTSARRIIKTYFGGTQIVGTDGAAEFDGLPISWVQSAIVVRTGPTTQRALGSYFIDGAGSIEDVTQSNPTETLTNVIEIKVIGTTSDGLSSEVCCNMSYVELM